MSAATYSALEHRAAVEAWIRPDLVDVMTRPFAGIPIEIDNTVPYGKIEPLPQK